MPSDDLFDKPITHTIWSPFFNPSGTFHHMVKVGHAAIEVGGDGKVGSVWMLQYSRVIGYESGYVCLSPVGQQPPAPPPEILETARYEAEERSKNPDWDLPPSLN